ncbi:NAD-dependent epimerase/dehydratase family protein [Nocardia farcinica]|uniref:NAD-dependent epimerase/dehydratase family protein n=1 Tax=Nocardia farcinica TaxID=37329 RepID=UPI0024558AE4|nr:NAD-dependent epimerase/dehydratase family protein [Nocardia farcinica]
MKVVIAGSSGLVGTALVAALRRDGHEVTRLVRRPVAARDEFRWDPARAELDPRALRGADAVVNLCGASLGRRRWTGSFKQELRDSRITPTDVLSAEVAAAGVPVLVNASGVHYYGGATGDRVVDENSPAGTGFLATLGRDWAAATARARAAGARTVLLRSAVVLSRHGGMLGMLTPLYNLGLGGGPRGRRPGQAGGGAGRPGGYLDALVLACGVFHRLVQLQPEDRVFAQDVAGFDDARGPRRCRAARRPGRCWPGSR